MRPGTSPDIEYIPVPALDHVAVAVVEVVDAGEVPHTSPGSWLIDIV